MSKKSKAYEKVSGKAIEALLKFKKLPGRVEYDVMLDSKAIDCGNKPIKRQIDVLANFEDGEYKKALVVEAKDWNRAVPMPMVDQLVGKLANLNENCQGMLITSSRFTKNAVQLAKHSGLLLYILRKTQPKDFVEGRVPAVKANFGLAVMKVTGLQIRVAPDLPTEVMQEVEVLLKSPEDIQLFDAADLPVTTLRGVVDEIGTMFNDRTDKKTEFHFGFTEPIIFKLKTGYSVPLQEVRGVFTWEFIRQYDLENRFEYLLVSPTEQEILFLDSNMEVKKIGDELSVSTEWLDMKKYAPEWFPDDEEKDESAT